MTPPSSPNPNEHQFTPQRSINPTEMPVTNHGQIAPAYSNNFFIYNNPHDVRFVFTEIVMEGPKEEPTQQLRASVAMGFGQAKLLLAALQTSIQMIERTKV